MPYIPPTSDSRYLRGRFYVNDLLLNDIDAFFKSIFQSEFNYKWTINLKDGGKYTSFGLNSIYDQPYDSTNTLSCDLNLVFELDYKALNYRSVSITFNNKPNTLGRVFIYINGIENANQLSDSLSTIINRNGHVINKFYCVVSKIPQKILWGTYWISTLSIVLTLKKIGDNKFDIETAPIMLLITYALVFIVMYSNIWPFHHLQGVTIRKNKSKNTFIELVTVAGIVLPIILGALGITNDSIVIKYVTKRIGDSK